MNRKTLYYANTVFGIINIFVFLTTGSVFSLLVACLNVLAMYSYLSNPT